jgi:hypothetical protein
MTIKTMTNNHLCKKGDHKKGHKIIGAVIAITGFFWLAKKVGWIPVAAGGSPVFWPAVTIAAGVAIVLLARNHRKSDSTDNFSARIESQDQ